MTLEMFPNEYLDILLGIIKDHPDDYTLVSVKKVDEKYTDVELDGINQPFDLLALGIRIGLERSDRNAIDKVLPAIIKIVEQKDFSEQVKPSIN